MWALVVYLTFVAFLAFPSTASAYVDPGTGSVLLQGFAFIFLFVGMFFRRVQGFVNKHVLRRRPDQDGQ